MILSMNEIWSMKQIQSKGESYESLPCAIYATDVKFQQCIKLFATHQEAKFMFSGKHMLHGYKVDVSVLPAGFAIDCSSHHPGSNADIKIFYTRFKVHTEKLRKKETECSMPDDGSFQDFDEDSWAVLCDKGYQGPASSLRAFLPEKSLEMILVISSVELQ